jgi:hypothetical protein
MSMQRPGPVIAICIVWAAFTAFRFFNFLNADMSLLPQWFPVYYTLMTTVAVIGIAGLWSMRKWGILVFAAAVAFEQVIIVSQQQWHIISLLLPMMVLMVAAAHIHDMR